MGSPFTSGSIGFRTGGSETNTWDDLKVTPANGTVLYQNRFSSTARRTSRAARSPAGDSPSGTSQNCVYGSRQRRTGRSSAARSTPRPARRSPGPPCTRPASSPEPGRQFVYKLWLNGAFVGLGPTRPIAGETTVRRLRRHRPAARGRRQHPRRDRLHDDRPAVPGAPGRRVHRRHPRRRSAPARTGRRCNGGPGLPVGRQHRHQLLHRAEGEPPVGGVPDRVRPARLRRLRVAAGRGAGRRSRTCRPPRPRRSSSGSSYPPRWSREPRQLLRRLRPHAGSAGSASTSTAPPGRCVDVRFGEELSGPQTVRFAMSTGNTYQDRWTLKDGPQHLETWGMRVFRYARGARRTDRADAPRTSRPWRRSTRTTPMARSSTPRTTRSTRSGSSRVTRSRRRTTTCTSIRGRVSASAYEADSYLQMMANFFVSSTRRSATTRSSTCSRAAHLADRVADVHDPRVARQLPADR